MLVCVGLKQKRAAVAERELLAGRDGAIDAALADYAALDAIDEVAVLSTCCRVEVYATTGCAAAATLSLRRALEGRAGRELPLFELHGADAFRHLVRTAASLESAVAGEPQILGQVKDAFERAAAAGTAGRELAAIVGRVLRAGRRILTETAAGRSGMSWGHASVALAEKILGPLRGARAVVLGAGEMARLSARHLAHQGASIVVLDRALEHAEALAREVCGTARPLEALGEELLRADVVVSGAPAAPEAFRPAAMAAAVRARRRRIVLVDLAVPSAIPPETGRVDDVYLCDVDDLERVMRASLDERRQAVSEAEGVVDEEVARWERAEAERHAVPVLRELRMHQPSTRLERAAADGGEGEALAAAAAEIFGLPRESGARPPGAA